MGAEVSGRLTAIPAAHEGEGSALAREDASSSSVRPRSQVTDAEWESLPVATRATLDFVAKVCFSPEHVDAADLFKHGDLNPNGSYIPPAQRDELRILVERYRAQLQPMVQHRNHMRIAEVDGARHRGAGKKVEGKDGVPLIPAEFTAGGSIMVTGMNTGEGWIVPTSELPVSSAASSEIERTGKDLGAAIVDWFASAGTLDTAQGTSLQRAITAYGVERPKSR